MKNREKPMLDDKVGYVATKSEEDKEKDREIYKVLMEYVCPEFLL